MTLTAVNIKPDRLYQRGRSWLYAILPSVTSCTRASILNVKECQVKNKEDTLDTIIPFSSSELVRLELFLQYIQVLETRQPL